MNYYNTLKELTIHEKIAITLQETALHAKGEALQEAQNKSLEVTLQKLRIYKSIHEKEALLYETLQKFNAANGIH